MAGERRRLRYHLSNRSSFSDLRSVDGIAEQLRCCRSSGGSSPLPAPRSPLPAPRSPLRLLVVDDEPDLRNIIVRLLKRRNHKVDAAGDGDEAWGKLQGQTYDCIILDLRMSGTGGQELFQRLSSMDPAMAERIIFLTGDMANSSTRSSFDPLANLVLQKPVSIGDLEQAIPAVTGNLQR